MEQEKWTNEVLNSLEGMQKAEPSPYLYTRIQAKIATKSQDIISVRYAFLSLTSIAVIVLISLSFIQLSNHSEINDEQTIIYEQQLINSDQIY